MWRLGNTARTGSGELIAICPPHWQVAPRCSPRRAASGSGSAGYGLGALHGLHAALRLGDLRPRPGRGKQQEHRGGVEGQRNHADKPAKDVLVAGVDQRRQRVFASTVSLSARLLRFASRRSSSAARYFSAATSAAACT